jgi:hypothetical protein
MNAKTILILAVLALALLVPAASFAAPGATITGSYVEFRNADVYTGPCFAMGEVGLTGEEAVLAWHIAEGNWAGVPMEGLNVVAVVRASATIGDPYANPLPARAVILLDARANDAQRAALVEFAGAQSPALLGNIIAVETQPIAFTFGAHHGAVSVTAGTLLQLSTRSLNEGDAICHNEAVFYQPLAGHLVHAMPVVETASIYSGNHLGVTWNDSGRRSSFVATFAE